MQRLFSVGQIPVYLDNFSPGTEDRRGTDTKIVTMSLRIQPFDAQKASAVDEGLGEDSNVRQSLFELSSTSPKPHVERVNLSLGCPDQNLEVYAAPDIAVARILLAQVKISGVYARKQKDVDGYAFCFRGSFGPVGRDELEFLQHWFLNTQFVTFTAAEPRMDVAPAPAVDAPVVDGRPLPTWDDGDQPAETEAAREVGSRGTAKRGRKKGQPHNPEAEAAAQAEVGAVN